MLQRHYKRLGLLGLVVVIVCIGAVIVHILIAPRLYTGRTTIATSRFLNSEARGQPETLHDLCLADMANLAASNKVIERSVQTLGQLGMSMDPMNLIQTLRVHPLSDTDIIAIEVTSEDPQEAKSAADVVAGEFSQFARELEGGREEKKKELIEKQLRADKALFEQVSEASMSTKTGAESVLVSAELKAAEQTYLSLRGQLDEAKLAAVLAKTSPLQVLDQAYVLPEQTVQERALAWALPKLPSVGIGLLLGLFLGVWSTRSWLKRKAGDIPA